MSVGYSNRIVASYLIEDAVLYEVKWLDGKIAWI